MKNSTILIVMGIDTSMNDLVKKLESIRAIPARVAILVVGELPSFPYYAVGIPPYGVSEIPADWQENITENKRVLNDRANEIEILLQQHGVSGEVASVAGDPSTVAHTISQRAKFCDVVLVCDDLREAKSLFQQTVHGVLFQSPVGILLNDKHAQTLTDLKCVFVAWNAQLHAARAVHQSLPILQRAKEVIVAAIDPVMGEFDDGEDPGVDVAKWLTHHGCKVVVQQFPSGGKDVGDCILSRAKEAGAELIVMGSYGHSRARQALFGGTTRTLIEQTDQAVYLAH